MSLGKAMIHARKQKSIAKAAACAGDYAAVNLHMLQMPVLVLNASYSPSTSVARVAPWCWCSKHRAH